MIGSVVGLAIAALIAWAYVRASVRIALGGLLAVTFLVPGTVLLRDATSDYSSVHRIVLALFLLNIGRKVVRGEAPLGALRPTRFTTALGLWVTLTFAIGVAMAETSYPIGSALFPWVVIVEYAVFFYAVTVALRIIDDNWWVAGLVTVLAVGSSAIAIYEHFSGSSYSRWLAKTLLAPRFHSFGPLAQRGGDVRVQAGFEFALAYAWAATILLPLVVVVASRARHWLVRLAPAFVVASIAWTYARSAYVGVAAGGLLLLLTSRFDRRILRFVIVGLVGTIGLSLATGTYDRTFSSSDTEGSTQVREQRLPSILSSAAERPLVGKGLGSAGASGVRTTDSLFLLTYAEMGVLGVAGLALLLLTVAIWIVPGLRAPPPFHLLSAAGFCGVLLGIAAGGFVDGFTVSGVARAFWVVAAIGAVTAEGARRPVVPRGITARRLLVPVAGAIVGLVVFVAVPTSATVNLRFTTHSPYSDAIARAPTGFNDRILINTVCEIVEARVERFRHSAQCYDLQSGVGFGEIRFQAPDPASVARDVLVATRVVRGSLPFVNFFRLGSRSDVKSTLVGTAPVWMALVGLALMLHVPRLPRLRLPRRISVRSAPEARPA